MSSPNEFIPHSPRASNRTLTTPSTPLRRRMDRTVEIEPTRSRRRLFIDDPVETSPREYPLVQEEPVDKNQSGPFLCDVVFSFDTTGSMRRVIESVRNNLVSTVDRLFQEVDGIRIGIMAHGDYADYPEMMQKIDLSNDSIKIKNFILHARNTSGADPEENYEFVLNQACEFDWRAPVKVLVVIGDESPHEKGYCMPQRIPGFQSHLHIDWRIETKRLKKQGIIVFSCHALPESASAETLGFYQHISKETGGYYFPLSELKEFKEYMVGICLKAADGAETIQLLKQRQEDLQKEIEEMSKNNVKKEEIEEKVKDLRETRMASLEIGEGGLFSSPLVAKSATRARTEYKSVSKVERYATEVRSRRPDLDRSSQAFLASITGEETCSGDQSGEEGKIG